MPVTKKKGAIFAIYADSPVRSTAGSSISTKSPVKKPSSALQRKALSSLPAAHTVKGFPSVFDPDAKESSLKGRQVDIAKDQNVVVNPKVKSRAKITPVPAKSHPNKKQIEVFGDNTASIRFAAVSQTPLRGSRKPESSDLRTRTDEAEHTPAKRSRTSNISSASKGKENELPASELDSPASRTRSRTRSRGGAHGQTSSSSSLAGLSVSTPSKSKVERLVGNGRGGLSMKKGRAIAELLNSGEMGPGPKTDIALDSESESKFSPHAGKRHAKRKSQSGVTWSTEVDVEVLADVSEAYGATGHPPAGWARA